MSIDAPAPPRSHVTCFLALSSRRGAPSLHALPTRSPVSQAGLAGSRPGAIRPTVSQYTHVFGAVTGYVAAPSLLTAAIVTALVVPPALSRTVSPSRSRAPPASAWSLILGNSLRLAPPARPRDRVAHGVCHDCRERFGRPLPPSLRCIPASAVFTGDASTDTATGRVATADSTPAAGDATPAERERDHRHGAEVQGSPHRPVSQGGHDGLYHRPGLDRQPGQGRGDVFDEVLQRLPGVTRTRRHPGRCTSATTTATSSTASTACSFPRTSRASANPSIRASSTRSTS